jgi:hypothetical protein
MAIKTKINTGKISGRIGIRILRPFRGYPVGTVLHPTAGARQVYLGTRDQLGNKVAEEVVEGRKKKAAAAKQPEPDPVQSGQPASGDIFGPSGEVAGSTSDEDPAATIGISNDAGKDNDTESAGE